MRRGFVRTSVIVGVVGLIGASPPTAQEKRGPEPMVVAEALQPAVEPAASAEIRALRQEMERLQQRIEQLENRPPAEARPPGPSVAATSAPATGDNALPEFLKHFKLSTLIYGDWAAYPQTGWGPQFLTQINPPGPGNDGSTLSI